MQHVRVTFVEVSDIVRIDRQATRATVGQRSTSFRFVDQAGRRNAVLVHGHPRVEAGMSIVAVLATANDWQSLLGWVGQGTGEIAGLEPVNRALAMVAIFSAGAGCLLALLSQSFWVALVFALATIGVVAWVRVGANRYRMLASLRPQRSSRAA